MTVQPNQDAIVRQSNWQPPQNHNTAFQQVARSTRKLKIGKWLAGAVLLLVLGGYWYLNHHYAETTRGPRIGAAPVRIAPVEKHDMAVIERTIGTVLANETVQVTPQVQGRVQQVFFKEGQMVKKGDLLFQIDPRPFRSGPGAGARPTRQGPGGAGRRAAGSCSLPVPARGQCDLAAGGGR